MVSPHLYCFIFEQRADYCKSDAAGVHRISRCALTSAMTNCAFILPMTESAVTPMPEIAFPTAEGGRVPGYLAVPAGSGPWPGVVVIQDVLGMTPDLRRITDRFAAHGYLALAPALYGSHRPKIVCMISIMRGHFTGRGPAWGSLLAAGEHLVAESRCTGKV